MGNAVQAVLPAELRHPIIVAIGHDAHRNIATEHLIQPGRHRFRGHAGGIGHDGIVEIQHQQPDILTLQPLGLDIGDGIRHHIGQKGKGHKSYRHFIIIYKIITQKEAFVHAFAHISCHDSGGIPEKS